MSAFRQSAFIEINLPISDLFRFILDIHNLPEWASAYEDISNFSGEPVEIGTTWQSNTTFMGRKFTTDYKIDRLEPGKVCRLHVDGPVFTGLNYWGFEATKDGGTEFTIFIEGETKCLVASLAVGLLKSQVKRQMAKDLEKLKSIMEQ